MNNFWKACPKKFNSYPISSCPLGNAASRGVSPEASCNWFINSEPDNFCFWTYIRDHSEPNGKMAPHSNKEIAKLLGTSPDQVDSEIKELLKQLKNSKEFNTLIKNCF